MEETVRSILGGTEPRLPRWCCWSTIVTVKRHTVTMAVTSRLPTGTGQCQMGCQWKNPSLRVMEEFQNKLSVVKGTGVRDSTTLTTTRANTFPLRLFFLLGEQPVGTRST